MRRKAPRDARRDAVALIAPCRTRRLGRSSNRSRITLSADATVASIIEPILVHEIDGLPLRMFASPLYQKHRQPDFPWHSVDDLRQILRLDADLDQAFQRRLKSDWPEDVRTVATSDGITTIGRHYMAMGMLQFVRYRRQILPTADRRRIETQVRIAATKAMKEMTKHLAPLERLAVAMDAMEAL